MRKILDSRKSARIDIKIRTIRQISSIRPKDSRDSHQRFAQKFRIYTHSQN